MQRRPTREKFKIVFTQPRSTAVFRYENQPGSAIQRIAEIRLERPVIAASGQKRKSRMIRLRT